MAKTYPIPQLDPRSPLYNPDFARFYNAGQGAAQDNAYAADTSQFDQEMSDYQGQYGNVMGSAPQSPVTQATSAYGTVKGLDSLSGMAGGSTPASEAASWYIPGVTDGYSASPYIPATDAATGEIMVNTPASTGLQGSAMATAAPIGAGLFGAYRAGRAGKHIWDNTTNKPTDVGKGFSDGFKEGLKPANLAAFGMMGGPLWMGLAGGASSALFGHSGKYYAGKDRNAIAKQMIEAGLADPNGQFGEINLYDKELSLDTPWGLRHAYDAPSGEEGEWLTGQMAPLAHAIVGKDNKKQVSDVAGWLANSKKTPKQAYAAAGVNDHSTAYQGVLADYQAGKYGNPDSKEAQQRRNAYLASVDSVWGVKNPNQGKGGTAEFGSNWIK